MGSIIGIVDNQGLIDRATAHNKAIDDMTFIDSFSVDGTDEEIAVFDFALPGGQTKSLTLSTKVDTSTPYGQAFEKGRLILRAFFALILTLAFVSQIYKTLRP